MRRHTPLPPLPSHAWQRPLSNVKRGELPLNTLPHRLYCRPAGCAFTDSNSEANLTAPCKPYYITAYLRTQYVGTWFLSKATYKTIHNIRMDHFQSGDIHFHMFSHHSADNRATQVQFPKPTLPVCVALDKPWLRLMYSICTCTAYVQ